MIILKRSMLCIPSETIFRLTYSNFITIKQTYEFLQMTEYISKKINTKINFKGSMLCIPSEAIFRLTYNNFKTIKQTYEYLQMREYISPKKSI